MFRNVVGWMGIVSILGACGGGDTADPTTILGGSWKWDVTSFGAQVKQVTHHDPSGWYILDWTADSVEWCREEGTWTVHDVKSMEDFYIEFKMDGDWCGSKAGDAMDLHFTLEDAASREYKGLKVGHEESPVKMKFCSDDVTIEDVCGQDSGLGPVVKQ